MSTDTKQHPKQITDRLRDLTSGFNARAHDLAQKHWSPHSDEWDDEVAHARAGVYEECAEVLLAARRDTVEPAVQAMQERIEALEAENERLRNVLLHIRDHLYGSHSAYFVRSTERDTPHYLVGKPLEIVLAREANSAASACTYRAEVVETCAEAIEWTLKEQPTAAETGA